MCKQLSGDSLLYLEPSEWTLANEDLKSDLYFDDGIPFFYKHKKFYLFTIFHVLLFNLSLLVPHICLLSPCLPTISALNMNAPADTLLYKISNLPPLPSASFITSQPKHRRRHRRHYQSPLPPSEDEDEQNMQCVSPMIEID